MSGSALIRALVVLFAGLLFIYWGIFNTSAQLSNETIVGISEFRSRLTDLGMGTSFVLLSSWIIQRQLRFVPSLARFGTSGNTLVKIAGVVALVTIGYALWDNARLRPAQPATANAADAGPAPAPAPLPPTGASGEEPASAPGPLPAAVPQAGGPASVPLPVPPTSE